MWAHLQKNKIKGGCNCRLNQPKEGVSDSKIQHVGEEICVLFL